MKFSDQSYNLRIELDTKNCELSPAEIESMERELDTLAKAAARFPVSELYITVIFHPRTQDFHVKTSLVLTGRTLFTGDRDVEAHPAYVRCLKKLVHKVDAYRDQLGNVPATSKQQKGTYQQVEPTSVPDEESIRASVESGNYVAFRQACDPYAEPLRKRIGRWVQRYPELQRQIDERLKIADVVDEIFLIAFEQFDQRPQKVSFDQWLEKLVDPAITQLVRHPDEELENISFARSLTEGNI